MPENIDCRMLHQYVTAGCSRSGRDRLVDHEEPLIRPFLLALCVAVPSVSVPAAQQSQRCASLDEAIDSVKLLIVEQKYRAADRILDRLSAAHPANVHVVHQRLITRQTEILEYESYTLEGERFIVLADSAIAVFERALPQLRGRDSLDCLFYLANAHGGRGVMQAKTGNWFSAVKAAFRSRAMLESVAEHDPEYFAAFLGLGVFDYYLSQGLKWLPLFDRSDEGIAAIERASRARFPYDIAAKNVLCWIYMERDRWVQADSVCSTVLKRFPDNSVFVKIATCNALWTQRWDDAINHGRKLTTVARRRSPVNWCDLLTGYRSLVDAYVALGRTSEAMEIADTVVGLSVPRQFLEISYVEDHLEHIRKVRESLSEAQ